MGITVGYDRYGLWVYGSRSKGCGRSLRHCQQDLEYSLQTNRLSTKGLKEVCVTIQAISYSQPNQTEGEASSRPAEEGRHSERLRKDISRQDLAVTPTGMVDSSATLKAFLLLVLLDTAMPLRSCIFQLLPWLLEVPIILNS